jgi:hypothetical protein
MSITTRYHVNKKRLAEIYAEYQPSKDNKHKELNRKCKELLKPRLFWDSSLHGTYVRNK